MIPVFRPFYGPEEERAVTEVLRSGWVGLGPKTGEFEQRFAEFCGAEYCVGLNSGTAALDMALKLLGINHGDEVIVPTMTFVSTAHAVAYNLAIPVFADIEYDTLNIDPEDVKRKITPRTRAIIAVHYSGRPADMDELKRMARGIPIIEDCAHAAGAKYKGKPVGTIGELGCWSYQAVKPLAMGEGGSITLNDKKMYERARRMRWLGIDRGTWERTDKNKSYWWEYDVTEIGLKSHLDDIHAAIGLEQLKKLPLSYQKRKDIVDRYTTELDVVITPPVQDSMDYLSAWHLYEIRAQKRDGLSLFLKDRGISSGVHYKPIHLYHCYGNVPVLFNAESAWKEMLTLPLYAGLSESEVGLIIRTVRDYY